MIWIGEITRISSLFYLLQICMVLKQKLFLDPLQQHYLSSMVLFKIPIPSISILTLSPLFNHFCGCIAIPTPDGVPVAIMSHGFNVIIRLKWQIISLTPKIMSRVLPSCRNSPFTQVLTPRLLTLDSCLLVVMQGPIGAKVSKLLPGVHWLPLNWKSRAETSFSIVQPKTQLFASEMVISLACLPTTTASSASQSSC